MRHGRLDSPDFPSSAPARPARHPVVFTVLIVPFGIPLGFVSVALAFLATRRGLTVQQGAELIATFMAPQVWKVAWAPIADTTLSRRRWYLLALVACAAGMFAMAALPLGPSTLWLLEAVILATSVATTFVGFAAEAMIAHLTAPEDRGRVSGWFQAGNLGGTLVGGGLSLWLLEHLPSGWETGVILAALLLAPAAVLPLLPDVPAEPRTGSLAGEIRLVLRELWDILRSRAGALSAVLCFVPVGSGAASGVLAQAEVAAHWQAGAAQVELVQGLLGGVCSMVGCVVGGYGCRRLGSRMAYVVFGALMAAVALAMAFGPPTPATYVAGNLAYFFTTGLSYAAFSAVVLDVIGAGRAATKYNSFASLSNTPIWYMGLLLAAAETRFGPSGLLYAECAAGVAGILVFAACAAWRRPRVAA